MKKSVLKIRVNKGKATNNNNVLAYDSQNNIRKIKDRSGVHA